MPESATVAAPVGRGASNRRRVSSRPSLSGPAAVEKGWPLRLGVLTEQIDPALVDDVVAAAGATQRRARLLPARAVVSFVLALCLFSGADAAAPPGYRSVARSLTNGLRHLPNTLKIPSSAALSRARQRLGVEPLRLLFDRLRGPRATPATAGAFAFGRRLVAWDSTGIDTPDTETNTAEFGRAGGAGHPQLRLLTLLECGTHALLGAVFDGFDRASEPALARRLLDRLEPGMLLLADRNFPGYQLWGQAAATGADLAWRIKKNHVFVPVRRLPDGSFLSVMGTPAENVRHGQARAAGRPLPGPPAGHRVRIVEYDVTVQTRHGGVRIEAFRLVTTLLDHEQAPAGKLAELYHQRWEIELSYGELKTRLRGPEVLLRSRSPQLVRQEVFAFLVVYQALCSLRVCAAHTADADPDRISFTVTLRLARDQVGNQAAATPAALHDAVEQTIADLLDELLPPRRSRCYERKKRPAKNTYRSRKLGQPRPPSTVTYTLTITDDRPYLGKHAK
jgi:Insertion element 4 transposase N-terminal/Transposase DDE domain